MTAAERFKPYLTTFPADVDELDAARELEYADDAALLSMARDGSEAAVAALFVRYRQSAEHYARYLGMKSDAPDVVSETFAQIIDLIQRGKGPERAFRAYLLTSVRHESGRRAKARQKVVTTGETEDLDQVVEFGNGQLSGFERDVVKSAYASLPQRWRAVLWELDVEGRTPQEVAERHGMKANAVSALAYRARAGLRESYLQQHVSLATDPLCEPMRRSMASVVRGTAKPRVRDRVLLHLDDCDQCVEDFNELAEFNQELGAIRGPAVAAAAAGATSVGWWGGALSWLSAAKGGIATAVVPAVAVGALTVAPLVVPHDHRADLGGLQLSGASIAGVERVQRRGEGPRPSVAEPVREAPVTLAPSDGVDVDPQGMAGLQRRSVVVTASSVVSDVLTSIHEKAAPVIEAVGKSVGGVLVGVSKLVNGLGQPSTVSRSGGSVAPSTPGGSTPEKDSASPKNVSEVQPLLGSRHDDALTDSPK